MSGRPSSSDMLRFLTATTRSAARPRHRSAVLEDVTLKSISRGRNEPSRSLLRQNVGENMAHLECSIARSIASRSPTRPIDSAAPAAQARVAWAVSRMTIQADGLRGLHPRSTHSTAAMAGRAPPVEPRQPPVRAPDATRVALPPRSTHVASGTDVQASVRQVGRVTLSVSGPSAGGTSRPRRHR